MCMCVKILILPISFSSYYVHAVCMIVPHPMNAIYIDQLMFLLRMFCHIISYLYSVIIIIE